MSDYETVSIIELLLDIRKVEGFEFRLIMDETSFLRSFRKYPYTESILKEIPNATPSDLLNNRIEPIMLEAKFDGSLSYMNDYKGYEFLKKDDAIEILAPNALKRLVDCNLDKNGTKETKDINNNDDEDGGWVQL